MAQRVEIILEDDLDGGKADKTVQFSLDGKDYEIDLTEANAKKLRSALDVYIQAARRANRTRRPTSRSGSNRQEANQIRQWAAANGYEISSRGRVPANVRSAYEAAH
ncbi:histone-like nucleoid-structuring protein Lsr2 [Propionibacteriaceae bacterium Y1700]|uniref:histone-like nucleoid-structuring protein Lsr2 n=1 Tax=Microlunatus sp. Y1700 TaxID=3418487 RepID=UPI003DA79568